MAINQESFNDKLYDLLKIRGYDPIPKDSQNKRTTPKKADVFNFTFKKNGKDYGDAWVTIDDASNIIVYYDENQYNSPEGKTPGLDYDDSWTGFLQHLKNWAMKKQLTFELAPKDRLGDHMAKREETKKEALSEGYYPINKMSSYSDNVPTIKIVLQHTRQIQETEQRFRNIAKIFLENENGERIIAPTVRPGIARVYARHLAEGGLPYDDRWKHIGSLVEEYTKMAGFVRATKNNTFTESAQKLVDAGVNHYLSLRETLGKLTSNRGYSTYFETFTPPLMEDDSEVANLNELFVQETLDPRIENVMPILTKLQKQINEVSQVKELENWADNIISEKIDSTTKSLAVPATDMLDESEERPYVCVHAKKGKFECKAKTSYEAVKKAADHWKLKSTAGIDAYLADVKHTPVNEAPGAETLSHNQNTEKSNLKAFDLDENGNMKENIFKKIFKINSNKDEIEKQKEKQKAAAWAKAKQEIDRVEQEKLLNRTGYKKVGSTTMKPTGKTSTAAQGKATELNWTLKEGYTVTRGVDTERYTERGGLEGPFMTKSGKVVYYDKVEGKYYDPDSDMYIEYDDYQKMNEQGVNEDLAALKKNAGLEKSVTEEVDTGEYDARKSQPSSKEKNDEVFKRHRERMEKLKKEMDDEDKKKEGVAEGIGTGIRIEEYQYGKPSPALKAAVKFLNTHGRRGHEYFDFPEYADIPNNIASKLMPEEVDFIQDRWEEQVPPGSGYQKPQISRPVQPVNFKEFPIGADFLYGDIVEKYKNTPEAKQKAYNAVEKKYGTEVLARMKERHQSWNEFFANQKEIEKLFTKRNKDGKKGVMEGYSLKKTSVSKHMIPGDPDEYTQDINVKDTDYEIINNKTGNIVGTASWTTNDLFGPGALKITMKNGATRYLDIWEKEKGNPQTAFNRFVKDPKTAKKYKEQGVAEGSEEKDPVWNKGTPMPKDYTCHCGIYVHPSVRNPKAIHTSDCPYAKKQGVAEGSDISGLLAASNLNKSFIITAELAEGGKKKFRVKAQSERVAKEKFMKHHSMAKIVDVKEEGVSEDLDANQKRVGQLGPTEKVGPKGAVGKLVGANESRLNEMDSEGYKGHRGDEDEGKGPEKKATPAKAKDVAKDAKKELEKAMDKAHKKEVKEDQEELDAILRIIRK